MNEQLLLRVRAWADADDRIEAVALVGSYARGDARPDSDVDLVVLSARREALLGERAWLARFGAVRSAEREEWGRVTSLRVFFESGLELELGFAAADWATDPDDGTRRVVADGFAVVWDPRGLFGPLLASAALR